MGRLGNQAAFSLDAVACRTAVKLHRLHTMRLAYSAFGLVLLAGTPAHAGDAQRGAEVLRRENCLACHSIHGEGAHLAPDLGRRTAERYTPAVLAGVMWNHAPAMWGAMAAKSITPPRLTVQDADDLFAYFLSIRFFDHPGEAERGKGVFENKGCSECHSLNEPSHGPGQPVSQWKVFGDPILLVSEMWNHSGQMTKAFAEHKRKWVTLTGQDLSDLTVYLQHLPGEPKVTVNLSLPNPAEGKELFEMVCTRCHQGSLSLDNRLENQTLTDIAADMWNHAPKMVTAPAVGPEEMRKIVAYVWLRQFLATTGSAAKGEKVFTAKRCASCHMDSSSGAPKLERGAEVYTSVTMISVLWTHGPAMLNKMREKGIAWPNLSPEDIDSLVAYLNAKP